MNLCGELPIGHDAGALAAQGWLPAMYAGRWYVKGGRFLSYDIVATVQPKRSVSRESG